MYFDCLFYTSEIGYASKLYADLDKLCDAILKCLSKWPYFKEGTRNIFW